MSAFMNRYGFTRASLLRFVFITANAELIYMFWNLREYGKHADDEGNKTTTTKPGGKPAGVEEGGN